MSQLTCNHGSAYWYCLPGWGGWACNHADCAKPMPAIDPEDYVDIHREQQAAAADRAYLDSHYGR